MKILLRTYLCLLYLASFVSMLAASVGVLFFPLYYIVTGRNYLDFIEELFNSFKNYIEDIKDEVSE